MVWHEEINEIKKRDTLSKKQGGEESVKKHHEKGRLTIRERIDCLLDSETFDELGVGAGVPVFDDNNELIDFQPANFVLGFGEVAARKVIIGGEDFTLKGGSPNPCLLYTSDAADE